MKAERSYDAVVVGAGPNGLAAAVRLARAGRSVLVLEARETVGGGARTAELTLPGFRHDVCSAIHPLGVASPFFRELPLDRFGLAWAYPGVQLAHVFDDGRAAAVYRSVDRTADGLGRDGPAYARLIRRFSERFDDLVADALGPPRPPRHPILLARFGLLGLRSLEGLCEGRFHGEAAPAVLAGMAAHAFLPLSQAATASFGLVLAASAHAVGWPVAVGGSQAIVDALAGYLASLGGEIETGRPVRSLDELPPSRAVLLDVTPRQLLAMCGEALPAEYKQRLARFRYGPGAFKLDYALTGPVPWRAPEARLAGTVHLGGPMRQIAASELAISLGEHPERPMVVAAQQSVCDSTRAPDGKHTFWAYCHVPRGSQLDMTDRIERQIERFAPGFRDLVLARHVTTPQGLERYNENCVGGDINGGKQDIAQLFTRPVAAAVPYATPNPRIFICSSSTPPGGGVHGLCGYWAASAALAGVLS